MAVITTLAVSAQNTWSDVFALGGDHALGRRAARALISATRDDSKVTLRRYAAATDAVAAFLSSIKLDSTMTEVGVPVAGFYRVGVDTGDYGGTQLTITVEQ